MCSSIRHIAVPRSTFIAPLTPGSIDPGMFCSWATAAPKPPATLKIVAIADIHIRPITVDRMMISSHEGVDEYPSGSVGSPTKNISLGWLFTKSNHDKAISPKRYSVARIPIAVGRITIAITVIRTTIAITVIGIGALSIPTIAGS